VQSSGEGCEQELRIAFERAGLKDILPRYAALRRL
jgi:hypothetical protein